MSNLLYDMQLSDNSDALRSLPDDSIPPPVRPRKVELYDLKPRAKREDFASKDGSKVVPTRPRDMELYDLKPRANRQGSATSHSSRLVPVKPQDIELYDLNPNGVRRGSEGNNFMADNKVSISAPIFGTLRFVCFLSD